MKYSWDHLSKVMPKDCKTVYLDRKGDKSPEYYGLVDKVGHKEAEINYINNMIDIASAKMSKNVKVEDLLDISEKSYSKDDYVSVTSIIRDHSNEMPPEVVHYKAVGLKADDLIKAAKASGNKLKMENAKKAAKNHFGITENGVATENVDEFESYSNEVKTMWKASATQGDLVHEVLEYALQARNKRIQNFNESESDAFNENTDFSSSKAHLFTKEALEEMDNRYGRFEHLSKGAAENMNSIVHKLVKRIEELEEIHDTVFTALPELQLVSKSIEFGGRKLYGKSDLVLFSEADKKAIVMDFKTKSTSSIHNFDTLNASRMKGALSDEFDNSKTHADLQTSMYAKILKHDYNITVPQDGGTETFYIVGRMVPSDGELGERSLHLAGISSEDSFFSKAESYSGATLEKLLDIKDDESVKRSTIEDEVRTLFDNKIVASEDVSKFVEREEVRITQDENNRYAWKDPFTREKFIRTTKDDIHKEMKKSYKRYLEQRKRATTDLVKFFKQGDIKNSVWNMQSWKTKAYVILDGFHPDTHEVYTQKNIEALRGVGDDVLVFQNKKTKEITLVTLAPLYNTGYSFHETPDADARTSILGSVITDDTVTAKYGKDILPRADTHNLNLFRLALVAAELKRVDPTMGKVKALKSVTVLGDSNNYKTGTMGEQLAYISAMKDELEEAGMEIPSYIENTVTNKKTSKGSNYEEDYFQNLVELIREAKDPLYGFKDSNKQARTAILERVKQLDKDKVNFATDYHLEKKLQEYVKQVYAAVANEKKISLSNKAEIYKDDRYIQAANAYLSFRNLMVMQKPKFKGDLLHTFNSLSTINDPYADKFADITSIHEQRARESMTEFVSEHTRLAKELIKEKNGAQGLNAVFKFDTYKDVFENMLRDGYDFNESKTEDWMRFKDPEVDGSLSKAEKEYIRFFNKHFKDAARNTTDPGTFASMFPESSSQEESWREGDLPILPSSATAELQMTMDLDQMSNPLTVIKKLIHGAFKPKESGKTEEGKFPWNYDSLMMDQADKAPGRGTIYTRKLLGISDNNEAINQKRNIEKNPILLLNMYVLNSVRKEHMSQAAFAYNALDSSLANAQTIFKDPNIDTEPLREVMANLSKVLIHGKYKDEKQLGNLLDAMGKSTSLGMFFGSWRQFMTETSTATAQTASSMIGNVFNEALFKGDTKYDLKDKKWAASQSMSSFGTQLMIDYGLFNSDLGQFTSSDYIETRRKSAYQTKWGFAPIQGVLRQATQTVVFAQMHKEGMTKEVFDYDKKSGRWVYNENKDKRFYVYDPKLDIDQQAKPPSTDEEKSRHDLWIKHRIEMQKEGSLKNDKMQRPFTVKHLQSMKHYAIRLFGAMDSKQMLAAEYSAMGRALLKFKRWMRQKVANWYSPTYESEKEGRWVNGEEGWKFVAEEFEGYFQSVAGLLNELKRYNGSWNKAIGNLSTMRKENISKLMADLLLMLIMTTVVNMLTSSDTYKDSTLARDAIKGMGNAMGDIFPATGLYSMIDNSPFAAVGVITNVANNAITATAELLTGDVDKAKAAAKRTTDSFGVLRLVDGISELMID